MIAKTKEMSVKKAAFLLCPVFAIFCKKYCGFSKKDIGVWVDQNNIKLVFHEKLVFEVCFTVKTNGTIPRKHSHKRTQWQTPKFIGLFLTIP